MTTLLGSWGSFRVNNSGTDTKQFFFAHCHPWRSPCALCKALTQQQEMMSFALHVLHVDMCWCEGQQRGGEARLGVDRWGRYVPQSSTISILHRRFPDPRRSGMNTSIPTVFLYFPEVLEKGTPLLASAGKEFDSLQEELAGATPEQRLDKQRKNLKKRLGGIPVPSAPSALAFPFAQSGLWLSLSGPSLLSSALRHPSLGCVRAAKNMSKRIIKFASMQKKDALCSQTEELFNDTISDMYETGRVMRLIGLLGVTLVKSWPIGVESPHYHSLVVDVVRVCICAFSHTVSQKLSVKLYGIGPGAGIGEGMNSFMDTDDLVADEDLIGTTSSCAAIEDPTKQQASQIVDSLGGAMSARERNKLKRKAISHACQPSAKQILCICVCGVSLVQAKSMNKRDTAQGAAANKGLIMTVMKGLIARNVYRVAQAGLAISPKNPNAETVLGKRLCKLWGGKMRNHIPCEFEKSQLALGGTTRVLWPFWAFIVAVSSVSSESGESQGSLADNSAPSADGTAVDARSVDEDIQEVCTNCSDPRYAIVSHPGLGAQSYHLCFCAGMPVERGLRGEVDLSEADGPILR
eukprot:scaffold67543_cov33-Prasinocladus_malaysianus.AAC.2